MHHRSGPVAAAFLLLLARASLLADIPGATVTPIAVPAGTSFWYLAAGPDGNLWVSDIGNVKQVGKLAANGTFTGYPLAGTFGANPLPYAITAGPDGNIWFTVARRTLDGSPDGGAIGRITPAGAMTAFPLPTANGFDNAYGLFITAGPDGNVWFSEQTANKIGKITPSGTITEYNIPKSISLPQGVTSGPDGNLWFTEYSLPGKIARITPQGVITEFPVPAPGNGSGPNFIAASPDGTLWFTEIPNFIWSMNTSGSFLSHQTLATGSRPSGIVLAGDGNLYFGESASQAMANPGPPNMRAKGSPFSPNAGGAAIAQLVPGTGVVTEQSLTALPGAPFQLVNSPWPGPSGANIVFNVLVGSDFEVELLHVPGSIFCFTPTAPSLSLGGEAEAGLFFAGNLTGEQQPGDKYEFEYSGNTDFVGGKSLYEGSPFANMEHPSTTTYYRLRVRRTCDDGSTKSSPWSNTWTINPIGSPKPNLTLSMPAPGNGSSASIFVQNTGNGSADVQATIYSSLLSAILLDVQKATIPVGGTTTFSVSANGSASPGIYFGTMGFSGTGFDTKYAPFTVTKPSSPIPDGSVNASVTLGDGVPDIIVVPYTPGVQFAGPVTWKFAVNAPPNSGLVWLGVNVDADGAWLGSPVVPASVPPASSATISFPTDIAKLVTSAGAYPKTSVSIVAVGSDPARGAHVTVFGNPGFPVLPGGRQPGSVRAGRTPDAVAPPGGTSAIIPTAVNAANTTFNATYRSDAWISNESASDVTATLYYTPNGVDGLAGADVLKTTIPLPAATTTFLHDLVGMIFGQTGSGQIEIRSDSPQYLSVRSTTEATTGGDPTKRFGTEIPVVSWGAGAILGGGEAVIPGVSDDTANRTNLILTETTGSEATVSVTVLDATGAAVGTVSPNPVVPPYGKIQLDRLVALASPGATLSGGWASVRVVAGSGHVVPLATVLDNASNSFSAVRGRLTASGAGLSASRASSMTIPSLARLMGAFNTSFVSSLRLVNAASTPAALTLTYFYNDKASGQALSVQKTTTLPARGALSKALGDDVLGSLFGLTSETYGWVRIEGDVSNLAAVAAISALVDSADPSKGLKTSQVDGLLSSAPEVMETFDDARRFAGVESSALKRTNLILVETAGQPGTALVEVQDRQGFTIGQKSYPLAANQYFQISNVVSDVGGAGGQGVFRDVIVRVSLTSGAARAVAFASVNDNVSRNPEIFFLRWPGLPSAFGSY